jgi:hypothetical protein
LKNQKAKKAQKKRKNQDGDGNDKKRGAKVKDKSAPKVTRTAFAFFQQHVRPIVTKRLAAQAGQEKVDNQLVMSKMGALWGVLDDERKSTYERVHQLDLARYEADSAKYKNNDYVGAIKDDNDDESSDEAPERRSGEKDSDDVSVESISSDDSAEKKSNASSSSSSSSASSSHAKKKAKKSK